MALIVGGATVTGTQTLDASKLSGNLPAIDGGSLTGISAGPSAISDGVLYMNANSSATKTAPSNGITFVWDNTSTANAATTIGSARNGGSTTCYNSADSAKYARYIDITF